METKESRVTDPPRPLRLWPGIVAAAVIVVLRLVVPALIPGAGVVGLIAALAGTLAIVVWWLFFSRAPWSERIGAIVVMIAAVFATRPLLHRSITGGMMGMMFPIYAVPVLLGPAFVAWAVATERSSTWVRRISMVVTIFLACGFWTLLRTDGLNSVGAQLAWRWTKTPEERLLAEGSDEPMERAPAAAATAPPAPAPAAVRPAEPGPGVTTGAARLPASPAVATEKADRPAVAAGTTAAADADPERIAIKAEWPGFRGPKRDGVIHGVQMKTDWSASPPVQMWRRPVGPGWSSFAVQGDLLYTQEQRGEEELVACYRVSTGAPVWRHRDPVRFWESNAGAGPRGTPTLSGSRVYAFGATGILNALDARSGAVIWSRNVASDTGRQVPDWGFSSSPLVLDDVVVVAASGTLAGYDVATGKTRWVGPRQFGSYSSPHRATIDGVTQVLLLSGSGAISVEPASGTQLWHYPWEAGGTTIIQPAFTDDGNILINGIAATGGLGTRRLAVSHKGSDWNIEERWTSSGLKPYFNDFVVHKGHAYGFDGNILASINLDDGARKWKGGRYGNGQLVLLADQDVLLVLSEDGDLALVSATPDQFKELARFKAIEGKTWNHPAVAGDVLLVRNGEEMAAFRLPVVSR
jgi:outer membrane protein assembly factor BamB